MAKLNVAGHICDSITFANTGMRETLALDRRFLQQSVLKVLASADTCCLTEKKN